MLEERGEGLSWSSFGCTKERCDGEKLKEGKQSAVYTYASALSRHRYCKRSWSLRDAMCGQENCVERQSVQACYMRDFAVAVRQSESIEREFIVAVVCRESIALKF